MGFSRILLTSIPSSVRPFNRILYRNNILRTERVFAHTFRRSVATIPPTTSNDGDGSSRSRKFFAAIGTALAAAGVAVGYKIYNDEVEYRAECAADDCNKCSDPSTCLHKMDKEEDLISKANNDLEKVLKDIKPKAQQATEDALKAYCEATDLIKQFMDKAYCAIENDNLDSPQFEECWCDVYETAVKRCEKVKDAMTKGQIAWTLLCRLREAIENAKNCKYTECNPLLITAEETMLCAERELLNAKNKMDCVQSESRLVEQYKNLVEDFRRDLKAELESLISSEDCMSTLTENECVMVLTHAYKKVLRVQKELAQVQTEENEPENLQESLDDFEQLAIEAAIELAREKEKEADMALMNAMLLQKIDEVKQYYEEDLKKSLLRQAQVLQEIFDASKKSLQDEFDRKLKQSSELAEAENLVDLRDKYMQATSALAAMEKALKDRHEDDVNSEKFKKLWSYCNSVYNRLNYAGFVSKDIGSDAICINKKMLLQEFGDDEVVKTLLNTIPEEISSAESLRERFFTKVDRVCRRVAIFKDEETISLWKYLLGTVQASMTIKCEGEHSNDSSVYGLLDRTGYFLKRGDLLEAVVTLNKIQATVPRRVCEDWLNDARTLLETNQTLFALMTHATANNLR